jgi:hypothetical protein
MLGFSICNFTAEGGRLMQEILKFAEILFFNRMPDGRVSSLIEIVFPYCGGNWRGSRRQPKTGEYLHNHLGWIDGTKNTHPPAAFAF